MPDGTTRICCMTQSIDKKYDMGNLYSDGLDKILNSEISKEVRRAMINGEWHYLCTKCKIAEESNLQSKKRVGFNKQFLTDDVIEFVKETKEDGSIDTSKFKMKYWDFRMGNTCNFGCRICTESKNSSFIMLEKKLPKNIAVINATTVGDSFNKILNEQLQHCEEIHFFGGESMIMKEHWQVLEKLVELNKTDTRLCYNINVSTLSYAGKHVFDYWDRLNVVKVQLSIDDIEARAEYQRYGTRWDKILANVDAMAEKFGKIEIISAASAYNVLYLTQLHDYFINRYPNTKIIFRHCFVVNPPHMAAFILPEDVKLNVINKIKASVEKHKSDLVKFEQIDTLFWTIMSRHHDESISMLSLREKFINHVNEYDSLRNESLANSHQELAEIIFNPDFLKE
jgi:hypothetical protein